MFRHACGCAAVMCLCVSRAFAAPDCVECHTRVTPDIVLDWKASKHAGASIGCGACHGTEHAGARDADKASIPTQAVCGKCHAKQSGRYLKGKHARAWEAMKAMPTVHRQAQTLIDGMLGCGGCHKIGVKPESEIRGLGRKRGGYGMTACNACHTRHRFSVQEARQPQACQTCHMGFDHPQWEMYSGSKHGVRYLLQQNKVLAEGLQAPSCQMCHMKEGDHMVRTAWGFLAVRLPMPQDEQWAADRAVILRALGVIDAAGKTTPRFEAVKIIDAVRLTQEDWQQERDRMIKTCSQCHSGRFVKTRFEKNDQMIREADRLMAEAVTIVGGLYEDGILKDPAGGTTGYPDLLAFHDVSSAIEQKLFRMFAEYRMRAFQGAFHNNPDYTFWYGWSAMQQALTEIRETAARMRKEKR
ncbi:MAG TPA: multiheme c-type cytochrome [Candidatus Omnitrophota bacterium]|nr:multiheme c-type cytochrome [Candidatus Omnitrophota bacterium]